MSDSEVFLLPDVGEGLTEADIVGWHVAVGDQVVVNDILVDIETAKSVVELPSPYAGTVLKLHAAEGETLAVGEPLITIGTVAATSGGAPVAEPTSTSATAATPAPPPEPTLLEVTQQPAAEPVEDRPQILVGTGPKVAASRRLHVRLPGNTNSTAPRPTASARPAPELTAADRRMPIKGVRKATAEAMVRSAFTAPHATMWTTVDVTKTMDLVRRLRPDRAWSKVRVSPLLFVARALALAVQRFPDINASWDDAAGEIVVKGSLNLGIAAATPRGLMVPNIKDAGALDLRQLAESLQELVDKARDGKLTPAEMSHGTLSISSVGTFGVEGATPIINPPEAAILAVGAVSERPWVVDGQLAVRELMTLSISVDHRLVDGQLGGEVLRFVSAILNDPGQTLVLA